jgi:hypothetical protein
LLELLPLQLDGREGKRERRRKDVGRMGRREKGRQGERKVGRRENRKEGEKERKKAHFLHFKETSIH